MKRALAAFLCAVVVLAVALYLFVARPLLRPSEVTAVAESALVTDELLLIGGVNVKQAAFLERWLLGAPRGTRVAEMPEVTARGLFDNLRAAGVDTRHDVDYALYALYPGDGQAARHVVILVGRFNPGAVNAYLTRELGATPRAGSGPSSYQVTRTDPDTCQPAAPVVVTVAPEWIVLADPVSHPALLSRLASPPRGSTETLGWWRALANADVASIGITGLDRLESGAAQPFVKGSAKALAIEADAFGGVYLGLGVKTVPPQGVLRLVVDARDAARGAERIKAWEQAVNESRARWKDAMPSVATLYDSLRVRTEGPRSTIEFTVDRTLASRSQRVINELLTAALGGLGVRVGGPAAGPPAERIDTEPVPFVPSVTRGALPTYDPQAPFAEDVDQIQGPFGLRLGELRLGKDPAAGLELVVESFAGEVPNVGGSEERVRLFVDSVKSNRGQELLRPETCGRARNTRPASFTSTGARRLKVTKTVRLIPGSDPTALQSVAGHIQLRLATRTAVVTLTHPTAGATVDRYGALFTVTQVEAGRVSYQIAGERGRVLLFRGLNAKGQPLASPSSFSSDFMFGEGVAGQKEYAGTVDRLEVVFAADEEALELPFTLTDFSPAGKAGGAVLDRTPPFRPYSAQALQRDYPRSGRGAGNLEPFELSLDRVQSFLAMRLDFTLRSPDVPNFRRAFSTGQLRLTRLELNDGTVIVLPAPDAAGPAGGGRSRWESAIRFTGEPKDGRLSTSLSLYVDTKAKPEDLKAARGILTLQFPKTFDTVTLDDLTVGRQASLGDLTVTVAARGRKSLTIETNRAGERVYYVRLLDATGQPLAFFGPNITEAPGGAWRFELSPLSPPAKAEVVLAGAVDRKTYPGSVTPR